MSKSDQDVAFDEAVRELCVRLWPGRGVAAMQLALHAGFKDVRQAQRILARGQGFSLSVYRRLMRSPFGRAFRDLAMEGCEQEWWLQDHDDRQAGEFERQAAELQRQAAEIKQRRGRK